MHLGRMLKAGLCLLAMAACASATKAPIPTSDVVVLSTLHRLHETVGGYSYDDLGKTLACLEPDILAVELTPQDLAARTPQGQKREYDEAVFPFLDRTGVPAVAMEPAEPRFSRIAQPYAANQQAFAARQPEQNARFSALTGAAYAFLLEDYWSSVFRVNDAVTDAVFAAKHAAQEAYLGRVEQENWAAWNEAFLEAIEQAAKERPGGRLVALVGAEHGYWLRERIAETRTLNLLPLTEALSATCEGGPPQPAAG